MLEPTAETLNNLKNLSHHDPVPKEWPERFVPLKDELVTKLGEINLLRKKKMPDFHWVTDH